MSATLRSSAVAAPAEAMRAAASVSGLRRKLMRDPLDLVGGRVGRGLPPRAAQIRRLRKIWSLALDRLEEQGGARPFAAHEMRRTGVTLAPRDQRPYKASSLA